MNRRGTVIAFLSFAAMSGLSLAQQSTKGRRIGFLSAISRKSLVETGRYEAFLQGLRDLGYSEGTNLTIEWRFLVGSYEDLDRMALELVSLAPDLIVATPSPAIRAAQRATTTIPIVMANTGDPVNSGFVASLRRPGGNITGLANENADVIAKQLELLRVALPHLSAIALLANPGSTTHGAMMANGKTAAQKAGIRFLSFDVRTPEEIDRSFAAIQRERVSAVIVAPDALIFTHREQIAALAVKHRVPVMHGGREYIVAGGLMSYAADIRENYRRAAAYVDKILKGAKAGDLPVEQPTTFQLIINRKAAAAIRFSIPNELLARADELIE